MAQKKDKPKSKPAKQPKPTKGKGETLEGRAARWI